MLPYISVLDILLWLNTIHMYVLIISIMLGYISSNTHSIYYNRFITIATKTICIL